MFTRFGVQGPSNTGGSTVYTSISLAVSIIGGTVLVLTYVSQWFFIFKNFKDDSFQLRQGKVFFDKAKFREEYANKYIGYQVAHMSVSFLLIALVYVILSALLLPFVLSALGIPDYSVITGLLNFSLGLLTPTSFNSLGVIIPLIGSLGFQMFFNRTVFFQSSKDKTNAWLRFPFWYGLFDYNLLYTNALIGITICISRLAMLFLFFLLFVARLDKTTMPGPRGGFLNFDPAFKAYIGMLRLDHRYNNPIFLVFGDIMLEKLRMSRVKKVLRSARRLLIAEKLDKEAAAAPAQTSGLKWRKTDGSKPPRGMKLINTQLSEALKAKAVELKAKATSLAPVEASASAPAPDAVATAAVQSVVPKKQGLKTKAKTVALKSLVPKKHALEDEALAVTLTFTQDEWEAFGVEGLLPGHFIEAGGDFYQPVDKKQDFFRVKKALIFWLIGVLELAHDLHERRCMLVRNKLQLMWRCTQQPYFRRYRNEVRMRARLHETATVAGTDVVSLVDAARSSERSLETVGGEHAEQELKLENEKLKESLAELRAELEKLKDASTVAPVASVS